MSTASSRGRRLGASVALSTLIAGSLLIAAPAQAAVYSISGTVTIPDDAPAGWLADLQVDAISTEDGSVTYVDVDPVTGAYTIELEAAGQYEVAFYDAGYWDEDTWIQHNLATTWWPGTLSRDASAPLTVDGVETGIDADLQYGLTVSGTVTAPTATDPDWWWYSYVYAQTTDGSSWGYAQVDAATGAYTLVGLNPGETGIEFGTDIDAPMIDGKQFATEYWGDALKPWQSELIDLTGNIAGIDVDLVTVPYLTDVHWDPDSPVYSAFDTEIRWLAAAGITTGYAHADGTAEFRPQGTVTRDAMAAFLYRFAGSRTVTLPRTSPFVDVKPSHPFYKEIVWLAQTGISTGWKVGSTWQFRPSATITRDAMAAFLFRYAGSPDWWQAPTRSPFSDVTTTTPFYSEITWLAEMGISSGWTVSGTQQFRPLAHIKRDAMAAFLYRYDDLEWYLS